jgi:hypothetical protein
MDTKTIQQLKRRKRALEQRMGSLTPLMRGTVVELATTCGHATCRCAQGGEKHKKTYFSVSAKGKTKLIYVGKERAALARRYADTYKALAELIDEMTLVNMELLRRNALE